MLVILVHWLIKKGFENHQKFEAMWRKMTIDPNSGLYREILAVPEHAEDAKFNTFSITDPEYDTYINIGIWKDIESFNAAVSKYIQPAERRAPLAGPAKDVEMLAVYQHDFEFKVRERIVLKKFLDRKGAAEWPTADLS